MNCGNASEVAWPVEKKVLLEVTKEKNHNELEY